MSKSQHGTGQINVIAQFLLLTSIVILSNRLSQRLDDDKIKINRTVQICLQMCGGLIGMILLILFPILIFNKSYRQIERYRYLVIFNWCLFGTSIVIGATGCYFALQEYFSITPKAS